MWIVGALQVFALWATRRREAMTMVDERTAHTFADLLGFFDEYGRYNNWIFRGQADSKWPLRTKLGRVSYIAGIAEIVGAGAPHVLHVKALLESITQSLDLLSEGIGEEALASTRLQHGEFGDAVNSAVRIYEEAVSKSIPETTRSYEDHTLRLWKRYATPRLRVPLPTNDWEWLAIGQHHGLATRLLDWTENPLAAVFFALHEDRHADSAVYALRCARRIDAKKIPTDFQGVALYFPPRFEERIDRQDAVFTAVGPPHEDLAVVGGPDLELAKITIARASREDVLRKIVAFGVDQASLFPDLDGISASINWRCENAVLLSTGEGGGPSKMSERAERVRSLFERFSLDRLREYERALRDLVVRASGEEASGDGDT